MPAMAQISSLSEVSPETPIAPSRVVPSWISTPPGTGTRAHAHGERAIGLAVGDLFAHQAGAILRRRHLGHAARIQDRDAERLEFLLDRLGQCGIEDLAGDVEGEFSH
jgi:hypothetical protein